MASAAPLPFAAPDSPYTLARKARIALGAARWFRQQGSRDLAAESLTEAGVHRAALTTARA